MKIFSELKISWKYAKVVVNGPKMTLNNEMLGILLDRFLQKLKCF